MKKKTTKSPMTLVLNSINQKTPRVDNDVFNKIGGFVISRILSYRKDLVLLCNEINKHPPIAKEAVYDFYLNVVPKNRKFAKKTVWDKDDNIPIIVEYYDCSSNTAADYLKLLTDSEITNIKSLLNKGGIG